MPSKKLRTGITTGTCAAAAAKAATMVLCDLFPSEVDIKLPLGPILTVPLLYTKRLADSGYAAVRKFAGDDPDVTNGEMIVAEIAWMDQGDISFHAGEGVGLVTQPGLQIPPGEPAINPVPRRMIHQAIRSVTPRPVKVTISIPNGQELARKTFNPRLGIQGGLSILGTTGIVRPFSRQAILDSLKCALDIAAALNIRAPVLVPGNIGRKAALAHFQLQQEQVIDVSNDWGYLLDYASHLNFEALLALGHPGKLAKLVNGDWDTHSSRSHSALPYVIETATQVLDPLFQTDFPTVDGFFQALPVSQQRQLGHTIATAIQQAIQQKLTKPIVVDVILINMQGQLLGEAGELSLWTRQSFNSVNGAD